MEVSVFLQVKGASKRCRANRMVEFDVLPRIGEFVQFRDYAFTLVVTEVTHSLEGGPCGIRVWNSDTEGKWPEVIGDDDLQEIIEALTEKGWAVR